MFEVLEQRLEEIGHQQDQIQQAVDRLLCGTTTGPDVLHICPKQLVVETASPTTHRDCCSKSSGSPTSTHSDAVTIIDDDDGSGVEIDRTSTGSMVNDVGITH